MSTIAKDIGLVLALFLLAVIAIVVSNFRGAAHVVWGLLIIAIVYIVLRDEPQVTALLEKVSSYFQ